MNVVHNIGWMYFIRTHISKFDTKCIPLATKTRFSFMLTCLWKEYASLLPCFYPRNLTALVMGDLKNIVWKCETFSIHLLSPVYTHNIGDHCIRRTFSLGSASILYFLHTVHCEDLWLNKSLIIYDCAWTHCIFVYRVHPTNSSPIN